MARKVRIELVGAAYHVIDRGNQGQAIYRSDLDRKTFLETLHQRCAKAGWQVHAYVLGKNAGVSPGSQESTSL